MGVLYIIKEKNSLEIRKAFSHGKAGSGATLTGWKAGELITDHNTVKAKYEPILYYIGFFLATSALIDKIMRFAIVLNFQKWNFGL